MYIRAKKKLLSHWLDNFGTLQTGGTVYEGSTPGAYDVRLHSKRTGALIKRTFSAADGSYSFTHLAGQSGDYYAAAFDSGTVKSSPAISETLPLTVMPIAF